MTEDSQSDYHIINYYREKYLLLFNEYLDSDLNLDPQIILKYDLLYNELCSDIVTNPSIDHFDIFISEINKVKFHFFGKPLRLVTNKSRLYYLINEFGFIILEVSLYYHRTIIGNSDIQYFDRELNYFPSDKDFNINLIIPIQLFQYLTYELNEGRLEVGFSYFENQMKSVSSVQLFEKYFTHFERLYNRSLYWGGLDLEEYKTHILKRNFNLSIDDSIKYLIDLKKISLIEYLIYLELQICTYDKEIILHTIFYSRKIGSFLSQKNNSLPLSATSRLIISEKDLYLYVDNFINTKDQFYILFNLEKFIKSIKFDNLRNEYNLRALFDYFKKNIYTISDLGISSTAYVRSIKYFYSLEDKVKYIKSEIIDNPEDNYLENNINQVLRSIENSLRIEKGLKIVGAYTNESILYLRLRDFFSSISVISQARPKWLGRQSLDIFFPEYNIAIEYQGVQHNQPIDFFGGLSAFKKRLELDQRKKELCKLNQCILIEVFPNYDFDFLCTQIVKIINDTKK
jgi:hypothetical protein